MKATIGLVQQHLSVSFFEEKNRTPSCKPLWDSFLGSISQQE